MKKFISLLLALVMALSLVACGSKNNTDDTQTPAETVELTVFAAASLTESLAAIGEKYMAENENVKISFNFDSSGKLYTQITEGAVCDLFISAAPKQMNQLDGTLKDDADAYSAGLTVAATATAEMCGQVIYPAAVLNTSEHQDAAAAFLTYLQGVEASAEFEAVLFTPLSK